MSQKRLLREYKQLVTSPIPNIFAGPRDETKSLYVWEALIEGPGETPYEGGMFTLELKFPKTYPIDPPTVYFIPGIWHPNVHEDGKVCISILHTGVDVTQYESVEERWTPAHSIQSILLSIQSMLADPNCESPANVDAANMYLKRRTLFDNKVRAEVMHSLGISESDLQKMGTEVNSSLESDAEGVTSTSTANSGS